VLSPCKKTRTKIRKRLSIGYIKMTLCQDIMKVYGYFLDVFSTERIQEKVDFIFDFKMKFVE